MASLSNFETEREEGDNTKRYREQRQTEREEGDDTLRERERDYEPRFWICEVHVL